MSNNYLQYSEVLDNLTEEEADWIVAVVKFAGQIEKDESDAAIAADELWGDEEHYFSATKQPSQESPIDAAHPFRVCRVWFYSEESDDPYDVAKTVRAFFKKFRAGQKCVFTLSWAEYCDKLHINEFGGGGLVVTEDDIFVQTSGEFIRLKTEELTKKLG